MVIETFHSNVFAKHINGADIVTLEGMPLVKSIKLLYGNKQDRVAGMDFMPDLLIETVKQKLSVFFFGLTDDVLAAIIKGINKRHSEMQIVGIYSPPVCDLNETEEIEIVQRFNN